MAKRTTVDVYGREFRLHLIAMVKSGRRFANVLLCGLMVGLMVGLMGLVLISPPPVFFSWSYLTSTAFTQIDCHAMLFGW